MIIHALRPRSRQRADWHVKAGVRQPASALGPTGRMEGPPGSPSGWFVPRLLRLHRPEAPGRLLA